MATAIRMTPNERRRRHSALLRGVIENDIGWWSATYLDALG